MDGNEPKSGQHTAAPSAGEATGPTSNDARRLDFLHSQVGDQMTIFNVGTPQGGDWFVVAYGHEIAPGGSTLREAIDAANQWERTRLSCPASPVSSRSEATPNEPTRLSPETVRYLIASLNHERAQLSQLSGTFGEMQRIDQMIAELSRSASLPSDAGTTAGGERMP